VTQFFLTVSHDSAEEPTMASMDAAELEAALAAGGFWVIEAEDEDAAVRWATQASKALGGRIEVRAFQEPQDS
jgi:hypothetical protein